MPIENKNKLESIECTIFKTGNFSLAHSVLMASKKPQTKERMPAIYTRNYTSEDKYSTKESLKTVYMNPKFYLNFKMNDNEYRDSVTFTIWMLPTLESVFEDLVNLIDQDFDQIYILKDNGQMFLNKDYTQEATGIEGMAQGRQLIIEFIVINDSVPGIRLSISNIYQDLTVDEFLALYYFIKKFEMYSASLALINAGSLNLTETFELKPRSVE